MTAHSPETSPSQAQTASKFDTGKAPLWLLDRTTLEEVAHVLGFGTQKYAAHNWRKGFASSRLISAALRHIMAWTEGEDNDPESGRSHLAHAICCLMFALWTTRNKPSLDDRWRPE